MKSSGRSLQSNDEFKGKNNSLNQVNSLWNTKDCVLIEKFPVELLHLQGDVIQRGLDGVKSQNFRAEINSDSENSLKKSRTVYLDPKRDSNRVLLKHGFDLKLPVHMAIGSAAKVLPELDQFFKTYLAPATRQIYPLGITRPVTLWVSSSGHFYKRHCDLGDALLIQIKGSKRVTTFDLPAGYYEQTIFDHRFAIQPDPYPFPSHEHVLKEGQALFIPRGMPHQVYIPEGEQSVAVTFHVSGLHTLINLCLEINQIAGDPLAFGLPAAASQPEKFPSKLFDPHRSYRAAKTENHDGMPSPLKEALLDLLKGKTRQLTERLPGFLDAWWRSRVSGDKTFINNTYNITDTLPPAREVSEGFL